MVDKTVEKTKKQNNKRISKVQEEGNKLMKDHQIQLKEQ